MHTHSKHQHPQRRRRIARNAPAHGRLLKPASKALKVIVLLGVLRGHHDDSLGWMKISVFERGDAPAPGHRGTQQGVQRSSCGAWEVRVRGLATHRQPRVDSAEYGDPSAMSFCPAAISPAAWTHCRRITFPTPARRAPSAGLPALPRPRRASGQNSVARHAGGARVE